jgi:hypothetical protein
MEICFPFGSHEIANIMDHDPTASWDRVARELRACKETQQKAWGDVDSCTLGRYLAGEVSSHERAEVEQALQDLPELRKLTDLVRDVLNDLKPVAISAPAPSVLPLPQVPSPRPRQRFAGWWQSRSPQVAAACLLLVFALAMPQPSFQSGSQTEIAPRLDGAVAFRMGGGLPSLRMAGESAAPAGLVGRDGSDLAVSNDRPLLPAPQAIPEVERPADQVAFSSPRADALNRKAYFYTSRGELARAVPPLYQAHRMCEEKLGLNHPATLNTARSLANVYQTALNADDTFVLAGSASAKTAPNMARTVHSSRIRSYSIPMRPAPSAPRGQGAFLAAAPASEYRHAVRMLREQITNRPAQDVQRAVVPVLVQALKAAPTTQERLDLVRALAALGPAARNALPVLKDRLEKSYDPVEVKELLHALDAMGPAARDAVPTLVALSDRCRDANGAGVRHTFAAKLSGDDPQKKHLERFSVVEGQQVRKALACLNGPDGRCGIDDKAGCFSVGCLCRSTRLIRALALKAHVEILFETVRTANEMGKDRSKEGIDRLKTMGARAVHVVFAAQGDAVEVHVSDALRREGIAVENVRKQLVERVRLRQYDKAVEDGVRLVMEAAGRKK